MSVMPDTSANSDSAVSFKLQHAQQLIIQMPDLQFECTRDQQWAKTAEVQTYLDFYNINFSKHQRNLAHGFGSVDAAGFRIATHYWLPTDPVPKGTLVIVHGYYDHVGVFNKAIAFGLQQGLAVLAFDLPGHGLSSGEQASIDAFDQYADVLENILQRARALLSAPYYGLGQSTGGSIYLNYLWRYGQQADALPFSAIALCAPLVLPRGWNSGRWKYALMRHFVKQRPRDKANSSHDQAFNRFIDERDCLQSRYLSVRWVGAMKAWNEQFLRFSPLAQPLPVSHKPLLVVQGDEDMTVDWVYNLSQIRRALPDTQVAMIPGARHQLVNEEPVIREQVFTEISRYFFSR
jgi:alpha-beta hydrolase superfamily lysophospholipase